MEPGLSSRGRCCARRRSPVHLRLARSEACATAEQPRADVPQFARAAAAALRLSARVIESTISLILRWLSGYLKRNPTEPGGRRRRGSEALRGAAVVHSERSGDAGAARGGSRARSIFDPVARALDCIGDAGRWCWSATCCSAPCGFQDLRVRTGIAPRVLSARLRAAGRRTASSRARRASARSTPSRAQRARLEPIDRGDRALVGAATRPSKISSSTRAASPRPRRSRSSSRCRSCCATTRARACDRDLRDPPHRCRAAASGRVRDRRRPLPRHARLRRERRRPIHGRDARLVRRRARHPRCARRSQARPAATRRAAAKRSTTIFHQIARRREPERNGRSKTRRAE